VARGYHATSPFLIVHVLTDEGIVGLGEVSCTLGWSGEDQWTAAHFIDTVLAPILIGLELGIAQAAMIHVAFALPALEPVRFPCDIISRFFYEGDIVQTPLPIEGGIAHRLDGAGLGVELDTDAIARYRVT